MVAQVMSVQAQQMNTVVYVDDGTGRIEARLWNGPDDVNELEQYGDMCAASPNPTTKMLTVCVLENTSTSA